MNLSFHLKDSSNCIVDIVYSGLAQKLFVVGYRVLSQFIVCASLVRFSCFALQIFVLLSYSVLFDFSNPVKMDLLLP